MKKMVLVIFVILSSVIIVIAGFSNAKKKVIMIYNQTELKIEKIFLADADKNNWIGVEFNKQKLSDEKRTALLFDVIKNSSYDLKIIADNGQIYIWENNNLCKNKEIFLTLDDKNNELNSFDVK